MSNESKSKSNNLQSFSSTSGTSDSNLSSKEELREQKSAGCNQWDSVPRTYDKEESTHKHEKTATNNQWTSTSK
ncbi:hypothetical protein [Clostridium beijerinckii]|uniref:hypothetical protein n=1 Tax=Clostridium beijerinckii TaxID=1520 RepID=UPI00080A4722|nr:hypothetical protein [Clostridium beijerinckii]OCA99760.1 hypothetical protein BGS1_17955 [Clostridium beijerinckii]